MAERQFGPYRLVQQIAVGGMAEIHLAKTHGIAGFEKYVALKMIHPNFSQDHQFIQMLIDEAKITVQLQHVNIAQTFDLGRVGDTFYITMEYVDGGDLYKLLRKSAELDRLFPIPLGAFIGKEVASGLDYAHRKRDHNGRPLGIVHRDVSPQNVLISYAGEVKLVDFGIAKATMRARQTAVGVIKGKYYYMSPEQAWGEPLDQRTDIFSAGILLYETLTGQMLYLEEDLHKLLEMVRRADIPPPSTVRAEIPPQLDAIAMRALAKRPEDRYQTAGDLANDLERFLHTYAPVFTANKVAAWLVDVLGQAASPTLLGLQEKPEPERDRGETRRITRDQLVLARSEFTDENSIIFAFAARDTTGGGRAASMDDGSTFDAPVPGSEAEDVDSLPEAPRDHVPARAGRPGTPGPAATRTPAPVSSRRPTAPVRVPHPRGPEPLSEREDLSLEELPGYVEPPGYSDPPTLRRLPGISPGTVPPLSRRLTDSRPRSRDQDTRLLKDPVLALARTEPGRPSAAGAAEAPTLLVDDEPAVSDEATVISDAPNWWSGPGDHTEVAPEPGGHANGPPASVDDPEHEAPEHEAPTLLQVPAVKGPPAPASWQSAPALAASVVQPAVSELRPPRISRRTPVGGVAAARSAGAGMAVHEAEERSNDSVLAALIAPADRRAEVALSPPTPLAGSVRVPSVAYPTLPSGERGPNGPFAAPAPPGGFSTRAMAAALERDEIPEQFKIRALQPRPWVIGLFALIIAVGVAVILLTIYGTGGESGPVHVTLRILSVPEGATVTVDGQVLPGKTPTEMLVTPGRLYIVGFDLPRYQSAPKEFTVPDQGSEHQMVVRLNPAVVKLIVKSEPPGAEVFVGSNSVGRTPIELPGLDPAVATSVELRLKGYRPARQPLDWSKQTEQVVTVRLAQ